MDNGRDMAPFGRTDGTKAELEDFLKPSRYFGGIARPPEDSAVRVLVGKLGAGKSLYLRRMHTAQRANLSVHTTDEIYTELPARNLSDLTSNLVVKFHQTVARSGDNTELWKRVWRAAIFRAAASYLRSEAVFYSRLNKDLRERLESYSSLLGEKPDAKRRITFEAKLILREFGDSRSLKNYLEDPTWSDAEEAVLAGLGSSRPLFLYIDAIDDNFKYAPAHWMKCQRGLFYAVMDMIRGAEEESRLHVVVALRDIALATTRESEAGTRYLDEDYINILSWNEASIRELLRKKVKSLGQEFFYEAGEEVEHWLGIGRIRNRRVNAVEENIEDYLIRHTRMVPRDIVALGNKLCRTVQESVGLNMPLEEHVNRIRQEVANCSFEFVSNQMAQAANQVWSDAMPDSASANDIEEIYVAPNEHQIAFCQSLIRDSVVVTESEVFDRDRLDDMNAHMSDGMGMGTRINLGDILWQNQMIGCIDSESEETLSARYYSLRDHARIRLPELTEGSRYVWNPMIFDYCPELKASLAKPLYPKM